MESERGRERERKVKQYAAKSRKVVAVRNHFHFFPPCTQRREGDNSPYMTHHNVHTILQELKARKVENNG